jgi:fatty-acid desaturase
MMRQSFMKKEIAFMKNSCEQLIYSLVGIAQEEKSPRCQAYKRLPKWAWLQAFITWVMGVPHLGQKPFFNHHSPQRVVVYIFAMLAFFVALSVFLVQISPGVNLLIGLSLLLPLLFSLLVTSGLLRAMSMYMEHYASHQAFGKFSNLIGDLAAMIGFSVPLLVYEAAHKIHHPQVATEDDPDQEVLKRIGFIPGQSVQWYWRKLGIVLLPGKKFWEDLCYRWQSNFDSYQPAKRKLMLAVVLALPVIIASSASVITGSLLPFVIFVATWLLPLTYGVWFSKVLFVIGLHVYFYQPDSQLTARENYQMKTGAHFFGDDAPKCDLPLILRLAAWALWWLRLVFIHLLIGKFFVMGGSDNQQHDAHHVNGRAFQFWLAPYSRHEMVASGQYKMWHTWGSPLTVIRNNFEYWSRLQ